MLLFLLLCLSYAAGVARAPCDYCSEPASTLRVQCWAHELPPLDALDRFTGVFITGECALRSRLEPL